MNCAEAPLIELLKTELDEAETEEVLQHLDSCEECRQRLHVMAALSASLPQKTRTISARSRIWLLAASVLVAVSLPVFYLSQRSPSVEDLAIGGSYPHFPLQTREGGPAAEGEARRLAFETYQRGEYKDAERLLGALAPEAETRFYIGVCQYLQGKYPEALASLRASSVDSRWRNASLWYQASTHLRLRKTEEAAQTLTQLATTGGEFSREARDLLARVREQSASR